ncbi:hypothetical protein CTI12_AA221530 [Artemisia annua]|uniref:ATG8-interacting protein 1 n=1 Tax=Artemisia annua TaxID=35608 RepID=A0A2U1NWN4_ARTAN|nr:hypothetical protein CTI12_AA221530 [Artemisia annua]
MADKEEGQGTTPRGADWEVVSLTASAYAAAPGGTIPEFKHGEKGDVVDKDKVETSNALFMSGHFVVPPNQHDNVVSESENAEVYDHQVGKDGGSESVQGLGGKLDTKEEENWAFKKLTETDFAENTTLSGINLSGKEQSVYGSSTLHSLQSEATIGALNLDDETSVLDESVQSSHSASGPNSPNLPKQTKEYNHGGSGPSYASWLKKQAACLYAHAKETNTLWPIIAVAAVMGIVVIGRRWHQEKWQVLRHELKSRTHDEKIRMMAHPVSRFKDAIIGNHGQDFSVRGGIYRDY